MKIPVCLMLFNRPDATARVFARIRDAKPPKLFLIADGPRSDRPQEAELVLQARAAVEDVDWPCEVIQIYSPTNLGPLKRFLSGNSAVFKQTESAIFLEDDTLPHPDFFLFCESMLNRYADTSRIQFVNGTNNTWGRYPCKDSYFFSKYVIPWGWASWRRAWEAFEADINFQCLESSKARDQIRKSCSSAEEWQHWSQIFTQISEHPESCAGWDYYWQYSNWKHNALAIMPASNLITNIGFGANATHTQQINRSHIIPTKPLRFPLKHPTQIQANPQIDNWIFRVHAIYEEARPWHRRFNTWRIQQGAWRRKLLQALKHILP